MDDTMAGADTAMYAWRRANVAALNARAGTARRRRGACPIWRSFSATAAGVSGRQSNVVQAAAGNSPRAVLAAARDYGDEEWQRLVDELVERGLMTADGGLSDEGRTLKQEIEQRTDEIALTAYSALSEDELAVLVTALGPLARAVVAAGDIPLTTPMGLTLDDDSRPSGSGVVRVEPGT